MKAKFATKQPRNSSPLVNITLTEMTQGEALALCHALATHAVHSQVGHDVRTRLKNAIAAAASSNFDWELASACG